MLDSSRHLEAIGANFRLGYVAYKQKRQIFSTLGDWRLSLGCGFPQWPGWARLAVKPHPRDIKGEDGVHKCGGGFVLALQPIIWEHLEQFKPTLKD